MTSVRYLSVPKVGNRPNENEDSFAFSEDRGIFAVSDGASDSSFAGQWARALTATFSEIGGVHESGDFITLVKRSREIWKKSVDWGSLPWFVKNKVTGGAYATFLGVHVNTSLYEFTVTFVGDSCLFHLDESGYTVYPNMKPEDFKFNPKLIWSGYGYPSLEKVSPIKTEASIARRKWKNGDSFILATDAMSKWLLEDDPMEKIASVIEGFDTFGEKVDQLRKEKIMRNDDVTVMLLNP
ncbi:MAG: hypothetical protein M1267_03225 [Candidatus Thermoplasmatota archaeon]|nr:hypothetical protein [Candidatus Thermoplasmatota archaeon]MCL5799998.1 hypothetical protein [Candidatus Thermoplasmatota archaeon]